MTDDRQRKLIWTIAIFVVVLLVDAVLVVRLFQNAEAGTTLAIVIITLMAVVAPRAFALTQISPNYKGVVADLQTTVARQQEAIETQGEEIHRQSEEVHQQGAAIGQQKSTIQLQEDEIRRLNDRVTRLVTLSMPESMLLNLRKLASDDEFGYKRSHGLMRELEYLLNLGYVHIKDIDKIPDDGSDLRQFVHVQKSGREFLELRTLAEQFMSRVGGRGDVADLEVVE